MCSHSGHGHRSQSTHAHIRVSIWPCGKTCLTLPGAFLFCMLLFSLLQRLTSPCPPSFLLGCIHSLLVFLTLSSAWRMLRFPGSPCRVLLSSFGEMLMPCLFLLVGYQLGYQAQVLFRHLWPVVLISALLFKLCPVALSPSHMWAPRLSWGLWHVCTQKQAVSATSAVLWGCPPCLACRGPFPCL